MNIDDNIIDALLKMLIAYVFLLPVKKFLVCYFTEIRKENGSTMTFVQYHFPRLYYLIKKRR